MLGGSDSKESACQWRKLQFYPWVGKIPWRREWQPTPVFLPGESHGQGCLVGYNIIHGVAKSQTRLSNYLETDYITLQNVVIKGFRVTEGCNDCKSNSYPAK